ncbi:hypothetical protein GCM10009558_092180 [Virgisporangium aurantiacum]
MTGDAWPRASTPRRGWRTGGSRAPDRSRPPCAWVRSPSTPRSTGGAVMALLKGVVESEGVTVLVATHDPVMMALADRVLHISDGRVG